MGWTLALGAKKRRRYKKLSDASVGEFPYAVVPRKLVHFNDVIETIDLIETGHDNYTFDNFDSQGAPRVSQTQGRRNVSLPYKTKCIPADTIWAHQRAVSLTLEGLMDDLPAARPITFRGRRPRYGQPYVDDLNLDDEYSVEENPNTVDYVNVSYRPMAFWEEHVVYYQKFDLNSGRWVLRLTDRPVAERWTKKRWHGFCHSGMVPALKTPDVNVGSGRAATVKKKAVVEWIVDSGAGVHLINAAQRRRSRFHTQPCPEFTVQGVGGIRSCTTEAVIDVDELGIQVQAGVTDSPYNLLSVEQLRLGGVSFMSVSYLNAPPYLLLPDGLHAIVLDIKSEVPILRQNDPLFLPEPVVIHDGLRVPASIASKLSLVNTFVMRPIPNPDDGGSTHQSDATNTAVASDGSDGTDTFEDPPGVNAGGDISGTSAGSDLGCVSADVEGGGSFRIARSQLRVHLPEKRRI